MSETQQARRYDLNTLGGQSIETILSGCVDAMPAALSHKKWRWKDKSYDVFRYKKDFLTAQDSPPDLGKFRSAIFKDGKLVCFAPPKSEPYDALCSNSMIYEDFIDGTMVNLFWSGDCWEMATRSTVGANAGFFTKTGKSKASGATFREMFLDAVQYGEKQTSTESGSDFFGSLENVDKRTVLSFVVQHPSHRIVAPVESPSIYLVDAYHIEANSAHALDRAEVLSKLPSFVRTPVVHENIDLERWKAWSWVNYHVMGLIVRDSTGARSKIRNSEYERVRRLRGNQPKLQYRYLVLRKERQVSEYLRFFPEDRDLFSSYRDMVHDFTRTLFTSYKECYVLKKAPLATFPDEFRTNMFKLHENYIQVLRPNQKYVTYGEVIRYVNEMPPQILMHAINLPYHRARHMNSEESEGAIDKSPEQLSETSSD
jgi:hypothetical protein